MPYVHEFGIVACIEKDKEYIHYEPEKYDCIIVDGDFLDELMSKDFGEKMHQLDTFAHITNRPYKNLAMTEIAEGLKLILEITQSLDSNKVLFQLISLYGDHLNEQEKILEPIHYLKKGFEIFFKGKIDINFDEKSYSLNLSKDFDILSTGDKQMIMLLSYIGLMKENDIFKPLIIIDEPELSLHISWQKKLLPYLLGKKEKKFLITTHSPYIANINYLESVKQLGDIDEYS